MQLSRREARHCLPAPAFHQGHAREGYLSVPFHRKSDPSPQLWEEPVPFQASPGPLPVPAQHAGCWPHLRFQFFHLGLLACPPHGLHPVLIQVAHEELAGDASQEVLQCQGLQVSLGRLQASQELLQLHIRRVHLQDDGQQQRGLASQADVRTAVKGLPQLLGGCRAGSKTEYPLRRWSLLLQDSQQVLQETQQDSDLAEELPSNSVGRGQQLCPRLGSVFSPRGWDQKREPWVKSPMSHPRSPGAAQQLCGAGAGRAVDPVCGLPYLDGLGQRAVLRGEGCQGLPKEGPAAAGAPLPWQPRSGRAAPQSKGPGQPPPPAAAAAAAASCCKGKGSKSPSMETARPALPRPALPCPSLSCPGLAAARC